MVYIIPANKGANKKSIYKAGVASITVWLWKKRKKAIQKTEAPWIKEFFAWQDVKGWVHRETVSKAYAVNNKMRGCHSDKAYSASSCQMLKNCRALNSFIMQQCQRIGFVCWCLHCMHCRFEARHVKFHIILLKGHKSIKKVKRMVLISEI